jgi:hypothetical protein
MSITLEIPSPLLTTLAEQAAGAGVPIDEFALRVLSNYLRPVPSARTPAEVMAAWRSEGLIGDGSAVPDSPALARELRTKAERRGV